MRSDEELLERAADELARATEALASCRAEHERVEAILMAVLEHVPVCIVVADGPTRVVRASSAAAEARWGASVGAVLPGDAGAGGSSVDLDDGSVLVWAST